MSALTTLPLSAETQAVAPVTVGNAAAGDLAPWMALGHVPLRIAVYIPLETITLRDVLHIRPGQVLQTNWPVADDIPVRAGDALLSWGEFENVDGRMATRLTRLA